MAKLIQGIRHGSSLPNQFIAYDPKDPMDKAQAYAMSPKNLTSEKFGVAIGSYRWPELVLLQIRLIREMCGNVPIMVSSDHPPSNETIKRICDQDGNCYFWPNPKKIGHTGGDIAVFRKAIIWGSRFKLKVVAKLSQRLLFTQRLWLQQDSEDLLLSGCALATQRCRGRSIFDFRTEGVLLDVAQWSNPDVLKRIPFKEYWKDVPGGTTAERIISRLVDDFFGGYYWPWMRMGAEERYAIVPGCLWHCGNTLEEYDELFWKYKIRMPDDFTVDGWAWEDAKGEYSHG